MSNNGKNIVHFEQLWDMAEKLSSLEMSDEKEIFGRISSIVSELKDIYIVSPNSKDQTLTNAIKSKAIGRLLFAITALSSKEKIDAYAALKDQWQISSIKNKINFSI